MMKLMPLYYVRRCKNKTDDTRYKMLHAAVAGHTLCGKDTDDIMWFTEGDDTDGFRPPDVTCKACQKTLKCYEVLRLEGNRPSMLLISDEFLETFYAVTY